MKFNLFYGRIREPKTLKDITIDTVLVDYKTESRIVFIGQGVTEVAARVIVGYHPLLCTEDRVSEFANQTAISLARVIAKDLSKAKSN